ncbi:MAG: GHKL domain-containing protein [Gammaproteobacteria bacterium]|nr:GHKL domain-containing protein [Gammaproteobacteria bacterium]
MNSLRSRLTVAVVVTLLVMGLLAAAVAYRSAANEARELLDGQLRQVARIAAASSGYVPARVLSTMDANDDPEDDIVVAVYEGEKLVYATRTGVVPSVRGHVGMGQEPVGGTPYRVYRFVQGSRTIAVGQERLVREEAALGAAASAVLPLLVAMPLLAFVMAFVIRRALRPLDATAAEIARRPADSLAPLAVGSLPDELKPFVDEIDRLRGRLATTLDAERRFLADAAHALRTPVAALQLQADVLATARDPAGQPERIEDLRAGVRRIGRLVQQLLAWARQDAPPIEDASCALTPVLREVADLYAEAASAVHVHLVLAECEPVRCSGSRADLLLAFANLVDNAIRVTRKGGSVRLSMRADASNVEVEVCDDGPGLPESETERVFERFYQGSTPGGGAGLGLATVRRIVERYGGAVSLANRSEGGLSVRVRLPRSPP